MTEINDIDVEKAAGGAEDETRHRSEDYCMFYKNAKNDEIKNRALAVSGGMAGIHFVKESCKNCDYGYRAPDNPEIAEYICKLGQ